MGNTQAAAGLTSERLKSIVMMVREGGFAVFAVLLLGVICWQQYNNRNLQAEMIGVVKENTGAIQALKTEIYELRIRRDL